MIREVNGSDALHICRIYNYYISNSTATFEEEEINEREITKRISETIEKYPWIVNEDNGIVNGYAYCSSWKRRSAYLHTAEVTVYVDREYFGKGIGSKLLKELIEEAREKKIHALLGGIALPNEGSIALFEKFGFEKVGELKQVGYKFNKWISVGYWEKVIL